MAEGPGELEAILATIRSQVGADRMLVTRHAHQRMAEHGISLDDVVESVGDGEILEYYPEHRRGPCCLLGGTTITGRALHVVCTTAFPTLIIITVYHPAPPKWPTPSRRGRDR